MTLTIIIAAIGLGVPTAFIIYAWWCLRCEAKEYNEEHDLK